MTEKIRILIVDDLAETRENVRKLLQFEPDVTVVAQASDGDQAIDLASQHKPDVILMDINMPGVDGINASQAIVKAVPSAQVIIMSVQSEADYLRRAMLAGARDFLMKPFSGDELMSAIRRVYETRPAISAAAPVVATSGTPTSTAVPAQDLGHIITVYSPKGGSGCTTVAINVAVSLAQRGYKTLLVDTSLQFGDVAVTLNMRPITSIVDLIDRIGELDADLVSSVAIQHEQTGLSVLLAPAKPEMAELVKAENLEAILSQLATQFDYVIVDTATALNEITLTALDTADRILLVAQQNLTTLTNVRRFYDVIDQLNYHPNKILLVANNVSERLGISVKDISDALKRPIVASIESDVVTVTTAADRGTPLVLSQKRRSSVAAAFAKLVDGLEAEFKPAGAVASEPQTRQEKKSLFGRMFSR